MKNDLSAVIVRLALFLNIEFNDDLLKRVLTCSTFNYMKERFDKVVTAKEKTHFVTESSTVPLLINKEYFEMCDRIEKVREGTIGS